MELTELIASRAHRNLRRLDSYQKVTALDSSSDLIETLQCQVDERILGLYQNIPGDDLNTIAVTTQGLHIYDGEKWQSVDYHLIDTIETPSPESKRVVNQLIIHLKTKGTITVPIYGGKGGTRDAWSFFTFLKRVIEDIRKFHSKN